MSGPETSIKDTLMRFAPAAIALSALVAISSSATYSAPREELAPGAAALMAQGRAAMAAGNVDGALDAYEAALVLSPGNVSVLLNIADATRRNGMQGKALHYYREALESDPRNLAAIAGEGAALAEKGAVQKAEQNLARLKGMCGNDCDATRELAAVIAKAPTTRMVAADMVKPEPVVSDN
ncbi:MAG: tetratricopeptide repeat protein [Sphingomonadaceae bacterium]